MVVYTKMIKSNTCQAGFSIKGGKIAFNLLNVSGAEKHTIIIRQNHKAGHKEIRFKFLIKLTK